jgi:hypothetical protein
MIDFDLYSYELKEIIDNMVRTEFPKYKKTQKGYNIKCPLCGNSKSSYKKGKGHFFLNKNPYMYYCFNSGDCDAENGIPAYIFMKENFPDYYQEYIDIIISAAKEDDEAKEARQEKIRKNRYNVERKIPKKIVNNRIDISKLDEFKKNNINELLQMRSLMDYPDAISFCQKRNITEEIYSKWLFVPYNDSAKCFTKNRIIIPFKNNDKQLYFYQARSVNGQEPKYKNSVSDLKPIFNYYEADFDSKVIIVEGPIDSLFLENSIATLGTKFEQSLLDSIKEKLFIFDNDKAGVTEAKRYLENGETVFMWKKYLMDLGLELNGTKYDFNDLAIKYGRTNKDKFTYEELKKYFTNNILMSGLL